MTTEGVIVYDYETIILLASEFNAELDEESFDASLLSFAE